MKFFEIIYYDNMGNASSIILNSKNIDMAKRKFYKEYGYFTIISISERICGKKKY